MKLIIDKQNEGYILINLKVKNYDFVMTPRKDGNKGLHFIATSADEFLKFKNAQKEDKNLQIVFDLILDLVSAVNHLKEEDLK